MLWTNFWASFGLFLAIFRCLNNWKSASAKVLMQISEDQSFGCEESKNFSFWRRRNHEKASWKLSETVLRKLAESYGFQSLKKNFGDRPPNFRTPSSETWPRATDFSEWRRISEAVLRSFAPRRAKLPEVTHFTFFTFFAISSPLFRLMPRVYPS